MDIAVTAIIKNEEQLLEKMLKSCKGLPVFILDTGSSDGSYDLYKKYGVNWAKYSKWDDCPGTSERFSFSEARNESLALAGDVTWRVILDADETLEGNFVKDLKTLIKKPFIEKYDIITVSVETNSEDLLSPRVLRNMPEIFYEDIVHNRIAYSEENKDKAYLSGMKIRSGYSPNHDIDPDRTIKLLVRGINETPGKARFYYYLAREYMHRYGKMKFSYQEAEEGDLKNALYQKMSSMLYTMIGLLEHYCYLAQTTNEKADAHVLLGVFYLEIDNRHMAKRNAWEAVKIIPTLQEAWKIIYQLENPKFRLFFNKVIDIADNSGALTVRKNEG